MRSLALCLLLLPLLAGCRMPGSTPPVVKLGLLAPFEGRDRAIGYHLLPATRLAVSEAGALPFRVEWVVLDTHGDPVIAAQRAHEMALDPHLAAVIGPTSGTAVAAVEPILRSAGIPLWPLVPAHVHALPESAEAAFRAATAPPDARWHYLDAPPPPAEFTAIYRAATGTDPWPLDAAAYAATRAALDAYRCRERAGCPAPTWEPTLWRYAGARGRFPGEPVAAEPQP